MQRIGVAVIINTEVIGAAYHTGFRDDFLAIAKMQRRSALKTDGKGSFNRFFVSDGCPDFLSDICAAFPAGALSIYLLPYGSGAASEAVRRFLFSSCRTRKNVKGQKCPELLNFLKTFLGKKKFLLSFGRNYYRIEADKSIDRGEVAHE